MRHLKASCQGWWRDGQAAVTRLSWRWALLAGLALTLTLALGAYAASRYRLGIDLQEQGCLRGTSWLFVIDTQASPQDVRQGDLVAFHARGVGVPFFEGKLFVKRAAGVPGDWVSVTPLETRINGLAMARGLALAPALHRDPGSFIRQERVPVDHFWMLGETADSFDSRYWGMLPMTRMIGKVYVLR
ncbi:signal peptidase I [Thiocystis minor]|nr:signal peptidase I [Thiocystis minor]